MSTEWNINSYNAVDYIHACNRAVHDNSFFNIFKRDYHYTLILEHVSREESELFVSEMKNPDQLTPLQISQFRENDVYGGANIQTYDRFGHMSPSTIRYIKQSLDLNYQFDLSKVKNIVEIGGGYGGLCKTLSVMCDFDSYTILDLPASAMLAEKYLSKFPNLDGRISAVPFTQFEGLETEVYLVISNYAFSECSRRIQQFYLDTVISKAQSFYMAYNEITPDNMKYSDFRASVEPDFPNLSVELESRSSYTNFIVYGSR